LCRASGEAQRSRSMRLTAASYLFWDLARLIAFRLPLTSTLCPSKAMTNSQFPGQRFETLVQHILVANGFSVQSATSRAFDFLATLGNEIWAVEVKYYRTARAQISLIEAAAAQLIERGITAGAWKGMLVVSCSIPPGAREELERRYSLLFVDRADLVIWASKVPELLDELAALLNGDPTTEPIAHGRELVATASAAGRLPPSSPPIVTAGADLCRELRALKPGRGTWSAYEKLCDRILHYLFPNDLYGWHKHARTEDGFSRFDYVCRIRPATEFWQFLIVTVRNIRVQELQGPDQARTGSNHRKVLARKRATSRRCDHHSRRRRQRSLCNDSGCYA